MSYNQKLLVVTLHMKYSKLFQQSSVLVGLRGRLSFLLLLLSSQNLYKRQTESERENKKKNFSVKTREEEEIKEVKREVGITLIMKTTTENNSPFSWKR